MEGKRFDYERGKHHPLHSTSSQEEKKMSARDSRREIFLLFQRRGYRMISPFLFSEISEKAGKSLIATIMRRLHRLEMLCK